MYTAYLCSRKVSKTANHALTEVDCIFATFLFLIQLAGLSADHLSLLVEWTTKVTQDEEYGHGICCS